MEGGGGGGGVGDQRKQQRLKLKPRLERRNAMKNIDYHYQLDHNDNDLYSPNSLLLQNETSLRVKGIDGEFEHIFRSLGLSGPEDFAIPTAAWEQSQRQKSLSSASPRNNSNNTQIESTHRVRDNHQSRDVVGGIKGVRPPFLAPPPAMLPPSQSLVVDHVTSTWDLISSFAPHHHDVDAADSPFHRDRGIERERERERDVLSDSDDESTVEEDVGGGEIEIGIASSMVDDYSIHNVSPNGSFTITRTFCSWQKGEILGKGSFGTVYEGFTE